MQFHSYYLLCRILWLHHIEKKYYRIYLKIPWNVTTFIIIYVD